LINGDGQIDDFLRDASVFACDIFTCRFSDIFVVLAISTFLVPWLRRWKIAGGFVFCGSHALAIVPRSLIRRWTRRVFSYNSHVLFF